MRTLRVLLVAVLLPAATGACAAPLGFGGPAPYRLTAYFEATPSLYEQAKVKVLGLDAGSVDRISVEGRRVRVDMTVDGEVPLPADVKAVIAPQNTLGERNLVLYPPWKPGQRRIAPGATIPLSRTDLPVEVDEALEAFTDLTTALDTERMGEASARLADTVRGRGEEINRALADADRMTRALAGQDEELMRLAEGLHAIASKVNRREREVTRTIDAFAEASDYLAEERLRLRRFATGLAALVRTGDVLLEQYQERLPRGVTTAAELILTLKANSESAVKALEGLREFDENLIKAWDREYHTIRIRVVLNPTARNFLQPLFDALNLGPVPCLPGDLSNCEKRRRR